MRENNQKYREHVDYLYSLQYFGIKLGLRNIRKILHSVGNPHHTYPTIHIAGTNGKGSTSSMIAAILSAAGYKVGLYSSPHLVSFNERIRINGKMISDSEIIHYAATMRSLFAKFNVTFFEATTAIMFKYFADKKVDIAVIETGMGGRLDSTNVILPLASVITSIGKDHIQHLGRTVQKIAFEKAGIIKHNTPTIIGKLPSQAIDVIKEIAKKKKSTVLCSSKFKLPENISLELQGEFQRNNALCAYLAICAIQKTFPVREKAILVGFARTSHYSGLRGRFEQISENPKIFIDVAHNPDAMKQLCVTLQQQSLKKLFIVFGVMKDKDYRSMLRMLKILNPVLIATAPDYERALPAEELYNVAAKLNIQTVLAQNCLEAFALAKSKATVKDIIVITGSHYVVGEVLAKGNFKRVRKKS